MHGSSVRSIVHSFLLWRALLLASLLIGSTLAWGQSAPPPDGNASYADGGDAAQDAGDPPARVARLSFQSGDLGLLPAGAKDWGEATVNRPLTTGDKLSSGDGAKAELQLDGGALRLGANSDFGFLNLNDQLTQVELTQGTLNVSAHQLAQGESYEIDTPTIALVIDQPGNYRVDISGDGKATRVTDFDGSAVVYGQNGAQRGTDAGSRYEFNDPALVNVAVSAVGGGDAFDNWAASQDQRMVASTTTQQYVDEDVVGAQDLDQYGDWQADADYGQVWYPTGVDVDWAPYRYGHWAYIGPWGWTWVDDLPWGFAPYHYGRWVSLRGRWGWVPGPRGIRPVYAPALVAFVGGGRIGVGGPVGWFPLGPGEVYNPWYRASRGYYTRVNFANIRERGLDRAAIVARIDHHYDYFHRGQPFPNQQFVNRSAPRGFNVVSAQNFTGARNVQHNLLSGQGHQWATAQVLSHGAPLRPNAASFAPPRPAQARSLPAEGFHRPVFAHSAPAASIAPNVSTRRVTAAARPAALPSNVRLLGGATAGAQVRAPTAAAQPNLRAGELPSARFAHPNGHWQNRGNERIAPQASGGNTPRPGASFVTNAQEDRARQAVQDAAAGRSLPNVPQFNRAAEATPQEHSVQPRAEPSERFGQQRVEQQQRFEQQQHFEQQRVIQAPQQQRFEPRPNAEPHPQAQPQHAAGHEAPHPAPRGEGGHDEHH